MVEVNRDQFYKAIGPLERCAGRCDGNYPYTWSWVDQRTQQVMGKTVPEGNQYPYQERYFVADHIAPKVASDK